MATSSRADAYSAIDGERDLQDTRWSSGSNLSVGDSILLLEEYVEQARRQWTEEASPELKTLGTMRKIAAMAVRCMETHGAIPR